MPFPPPLRHLLTALSRTRDDEIDCQTCFELLDAYADLDARDASATASYPRVAHHLKQCRDCREEYKALRAAMNAMDQEG